VKQRAACVFIALLRLVWLFFANHHTFRDITIGNDKNWVFVFRNTEHYVQQVKRIPSCSSFADPNLLGIFRLLRHTLFRGNRSLFRSSRAVVTSVQVSWGLSHNLPWNFDHSLKVLWSKCLLLCFSTHIHDMYTGKRYPAICKFLCGCIQIFISFFSDSKKMRKNNVGEFVFEWRRLPHQIRECVKYNWIRPFIPRKQPPHDPSHTLQHSKHTLPGSSLSHGETPCCGDIEPRWQSDWLRPGLHRATRDQTNQHPEHIRPTARGQLCHKFYCVNVRWRVKGSLFAVAEDSV